MTQLEALEFLQPAHINLAETWADLGAGTGTFTKVLAELVGPSGTVHAVDKDNYALSQLTLTNPSIITQQQDFTKPLALKNLDGILMANSLHFVRQQEKVLESLQTYLKSTGKFIIIEYNINRLNPWVPFPVSFERLQQLAARVGLNKPLKVATKPSRYHREMYVASIALKKVR
jgi:ubiquinone/menaquinone biosynthesis C-methylase UbiE